ncbi:MAG: hypothetical protein NZ750_11230 [Anaerolineae bacterium]|nr:hypothetical protein [Anaerolineae bacterium]MDW8172060.1 hypothetical protein [Anaerolineae bacterium]
MTPQAFDLLVIAVMVLGGCLAVWRFMRDMRRPLPPTPPHHQPPQEK